ncbi:MAG: polymer-forming cytoskeletal protein [Nitrospirae bacterium]|nr:polymer-forming cytoskeletal protein [Nitrospirota bacterium]
MFLRRNNQLDALIGVNTEFRGDIVSGGTLRVDGKIFGNVVADWVVLGEAGSLKGNIKAKGVVIGGRVDGNINADELVDIKHTGSLLGDIHTRKLSVAEGGVFEGRSLVQRDEDLKVIDFPAKEAIS